MNHPESAPCEFFELTAFFSSLYKQMCLLLRRESPKLVSDSPRSCQPEPFKERHPTHGITHLNGKVPLEFTYKQTAECWLPARETSESRFLPQLTSTTNLTCTACTPGTASPAHSAHCSQTPALAWRNCPGAYLYFGLDW